MESRWETGELRYCRARAFFLLLHISAEAAIALRQRLNEAVEELDTLKKEHTELGVKYDTQARELTVTKSDCAYPTFYQMSCICKCLSLQ